MKKPGVKLNGRRLWIALLLGGLATIIGLSIAFALESLGAPSWLGAVFGAPLLFGAWLGGNNVHSDFFLPGMLMGFALSVLIWSVVLWPLAHWFTPED